MKISTLIDWYKKGETILLCENMRCIAPLPFVKKEENSNFGKGAAHRFRLYVAVIKENTTYRSLPRRYIEHIARKFIRQKNNINQKR